MRILPSRPPRTPMTVVVDPCARAWRKGEAVHTHPACPISAFLAALQTDGPM